MAHDESSKLGSAKGGVPAGGAIVPETRSLLTRGDATVFVQQSWFDGFQSHATHHDAAAHASQHAAADGVLDCTPPVPWSTPCSIVPH